MEQPLRDPTKQDLKPDESPLRKAIVDGILKQGFGTKALVEAAIDHWADGHAAQGPFEHGVYAACDQVWAGYLKSLES